MRRLISIFEGWSLLGYGFAIFTLVGLAYQAEVLPDLEPVTTSSIEEPASD